MSDHVEALRGVVEDQITSVNRLTAEYIQELAVVQRFIIAGVAADPGRISIRPDGAWVLCEEVLVRLHQDGSIQTANSVWFDQFYRDREFIPYPDKTAEVDEMMALLQSVYLTNLAVKDGISELKRLGEHILRG